MELVGVVSFVFVLADVAATSSDNPFTCEAGNFSSGETAAITCHFGPNIYNDGYDLEIVHYAFDALDSDTGDTVLQCHWIDKAHQCKTKSGFNFDRKVQENVTLTIPQVKLEFAGRYACQLIPPDDRTPRLCDLHVDEVEVASSIFRHDTCSEKVLGLSVLVGLLLLLCCFITIYFKCRKRKRKLLQALSCFKRVRRQTTDEDVTVNLLLGGHSSERQQPFKMPPIKPYTDSDLEDEPEEEKQNTKFAGDDEDARQQPFKMPPIKPYTDSDLEDEPEEEKQNTKFAGDDEDARKPYKLTIKAYDEDETDQIGSPAPRVQIRYPHHPYRPV